MLLRNGHPVFYVIVVGVDEERKPLQNAPHGFTCVFEIL